MYWDDLEVHDGGSRIEEIWLSHPTVRSEVNRRISGDPAVGATAWFGETFVRHLPLRSAVVIGCGTGALERDLVSRNVTAHVHAVDIARGPISRAAQLAAEQGLENRITYVEQDAATYLAAHPAAFDAAFFHASLHHFEPEGILTAARGALRPGGFVYFDEYVGPSRDEWSIRRLLIPNLAYRLLPHALLRPHLVRAPVNAEDPTEAVASRRIMPAVRELFDVVAVRPYGGNLLALVYANLHRPPVACPETLNRGVRRLIRLENLLSAAGAVSYYAVVVARAKTKDAAANQCDGPSVEA